MTSTTRVAAILGLALIAPLAAACSHDGAEPRAATQSTAAPSAAAPSHTAPSPSATAAADVAAAPSTGQHTRTSPAPPTTTGPARTDLADGDHVAHVIRVDPATRAVTVDVIQFLTGDAAARAAAQDGAEVPPPNDYYVRNTSSRLRTLPVASGAPITVNVLGAPESGSATKDIPKTLAQLAGIHGVEDGTFRLTLEHGRVTRIAEIYLP